MKIKIFLLSILLASSHLAYSAEKPAENQCVDMYKPDKYAEELLIYKKLAEQGDAKAQDSLGSMYSNGYGVAQDQEQAVIWFTKAAKQGYAEAQTDLGITYEEAQDYKQAVKWYTKAAKQGYSEAQFHLGIMYKNGQGVTKDYKQAYAWAAIADSTIVASRELAAEVLSKDELKQAKKLANEYYKKYGSHQ